jgi:hypothetical protein
VVRRREPVRRHGVPARAAAELPRRDPPAAPADPDRQWWRASYASAGRADADACNLFDQGDLAPIEHKLSVLRRHCDDVGRDYDEITKTVAAFLPEGGPAKVAEHFEQLADLGIDLVVVELPGTDASAVDPVAEAANAVASYGRPAPAALEPAGGLLNGARTG